MPEPANPVLVFGEELAFRARIARMLKGVGIGAELASTWDRALTLASKQRFHLGIVTPPGALPLMTVQELHPHIPRLLLFGTPKEIERLRQLSRYACVLPISCSDEQLLERIKTMLPPVEPDPGLAVVSLDDCHIDLTNRLYVGRDGHTIGLTVAETMLLKELAREPGQIRTRDQLRNAVAGRGADRFDRSIDMLIARLRQKIEADPKVPRLIITVPKLGYRLLRKSSGDPANSTAAAGEKRQITVLSCKIAHWAAYAAGRDPEDLSEISQRFRAAAKATVEALGGAIFTQNQDAFFAAFSRSPEHDAECAVRASMDLAQHVTTLQLRGSQQPLQLQVGVASGLVLLGDSQVIGEPVNVAAVLRDSSGPNAPLVDTNTQKLAFNAFSFERSEPVTSPELPRKIPAFRLVRQRRELSTAISQSAP
jgi:DNA-binding response OmpR family regulator